MKKLQIVLLLSVLLIASISYAGAPLFMFVSGTNDPLVNGTYSYNLGGSWSKGNYVLRWTTFEMGEKWVIENKENSNVYYINWETDSSPAETGWSCVSHAISPCTPPVVTTTSLPERLIVSGTVDSFLNGAYLRGLNYNGYPRYSRSNFEIRHGFDIMTSVWTLENAVTNNRYYTHPTIGANVPERDWLLGDSAGTPPSPPLVTETTLPYKYKVKGAGSSQVDGVYTRTTNSHNGLVYVKDGGYSLEAGYFYIMEMGYGITQSGIADYYSVVSDSLIIPSTGWAIIHLGVADIPSVTPYIFPWAIFMPPLLR